MTDAAVRSSCPPPPPRLPDRLRVRPWPDPVLDQLGHDPRSWYVETFWLPQLGPSATWLLRRLVAGLEESPSGLVVAVGDTARSLGLGGRLEVFSRALQRVVWFDLARLDPDGTLALRRRVPPLTRRQVQRLPSELLAAHAAWQADQSGRGAVDAMRRRSRRLALSLLELGEDLESTERQLMRWRYHPALAHESALWAWGRHAGAARAAAGGGTPGGSCAQPPAGAPARSSISVRTPKPVPPLVT